MGREVLTSELFPYAVRYADKHILLNEQPVPIDAFPRVGRIYERDVVPAK